MQKQILKKSWKEFFSKFLITVGMRGSLLISPLLLSAIIDSVASSNFESAYIYALVLLILLVAFRILEILNTFSWHKLYNKLYHLYSKLAIEKTYDNSIYPSRFFLCASQ